MISPNMHTYAKSKISRMCLKNVDANMYKMVRISISTKDTSTYITSGSDEFCPSLSRTLYVVKPRCS